MKRIKTLLIFSLVIALSFSLFGCKLLPWGDSAAEETATITALPQWLTLAHRAEAAEEPEVEEEEAAEEEEAPAQTATTQPVTTQPATTQPAQTEQPAQTGKPRWQQPGTMEYLAKIQLDEKYTSYRRLIGLANPDKDDKERIPTLLLEMYEIARGIGLDLEKEYGIKVASGGATNDWFHNWDNSPSGFGN